MILVVSVGSNLKGLHAKRCRACFAKATASSTKSLSTSNYTSAPQGCRRNAFATLSLSGRQSFRSTAPSCKL